MLNSDQLLRVRHYKLRQDLLYFTRYFFLQREGARFAVQPHHQIIADALMGVIEGEYPNLLINIPPGAGKTELAVIQFVAYALANNPSARFLHISSSEVLATLNAAKIKEQVQSDAFQTLFPLRFKQDRAAKHHWAVTPPNGGSEGGVYAAPLGGQITGFRAGRLAAGFQGAIIIDDPQKPEDVLSPTKRETAKRQLLYTVKTRKASAATPMIIIMQRLHEDDVSDFVLKGGLDMYFHHACIPALQQAKETQADVSYWEEKEPVAQLQSLRKNAPYLYHSQYQQAPVALEAEVFRPNWWTLYETLPLLAYGAIFVDTAMKTGAKSDYSVLQYWALGEDGKAYLLEQQRGRWEWPELQENVLEFWQRCQQLNLCPIRFLAVEDKVAGTSLLQQLTRQYRLPLKAISRTRKSGSKLKRAMDVQHLVSTGLACLPKHKPWLQSFLYEASHFPKADHDDQVDVMVDALSYFFLQSTHQDRPNITIKGMY